MAGSTPREMLEKIPTENVKLKKWLIDISELLSPKNIVFVDGSRNEWENLTNKLTQQGSLTKLNSSIKPNSFLARSSADDVARIEARTFICSETKTAAGPTNNWVDPKEMRQTLTKLFKNTMVGRTMYVIAYCMNPIDSEHAKIGIEVTDSEYVVLSMHIMTRLGKQVWDKLNGDTPFVKGVHSVGYPLPDEKTDVIWPCNSTKYISHFPETREIWSYGSGYGGNALLGKKCFALRIASVMARDEGWLAEHMLILKLTNPQGKSYFVAAAFPSQCGKTNLAMIQPTLPGWKAETLGDDIAWIHLGADGRLYASNPEFGFFGVAPGTNQKSNPIAMETLAKGNTIYTNVALTATKDVWWEGLTKNPPANLIDWLGNSYIPNNETKAAQANSRYTVPLTNCPALAPEWNSPIGVPLDAILFGGRRKTTIPLVTEAIDWNNGVFLGATLSSEQTAAAEGVVGKVRYDPMAMLPFLGYALGDYLNHWISIQTKTSPTKLPKIFLVNWFKQNQAGKFIWPGFGENSRVLKWIVERIEGKVDGINTPIGITPKPEDLDISGLEITAAEIQELVAFNKREWQQEIPLLENYFKFIGSDLPKQLAEKLNELKTALTIN